MNAPASTPESDRQALALDFQGALTPCALLPKDLRLWIDEATLTHWTLEAVSDQLHGHFAPPIHPPRLRGPQPPLLLNVLVYSYATGRLDSEEIAGLVATDPVLGYLSGKQPITGQLLRRFRRVCRHSLQACLAILFRRAWLQGEDLRSHTDRGSTALGRPSTLSPEIHGALLWTAEDRVRRALLADTMALDEI
jgi:hypothetical protein